MITPPTDPPHVLVVEDSPTFAAIVVEMLSPICDVTTTATLAGALRLLETATPDLILLDLNLPDSRDGETAARVSQKTLVPIVACSSCSAGEVAALTRRVKAAGAVDFLEKGGARWERWCTIEGRDDLMRTILGWIAGGKRDHEPAEAEDEAVRVLIVEDDSRMIEPIKLAVSAAVPKAYCDSTDSLAQAREMLRSLKYRLVILDLELTDSAGMATLDAIAEHVGLEHILVVSGYGDLGQQVLQRPGGRFIPKPFRLADLSEAIAKAASSRPPAVSLFGLLQAAHDDLKETLYHGSRA